MKGLKRFPLATLAVVGLVLGGMASMEGVAYAEGEIGGAIIATQNFASDADVNDEFEYCLESQTAGAPMPDGANGQKYCFTMKGNDKHTMRLRASASAPAVSKYTLRLVTQLSKGYELLSTDMYRYEVYAHPGDGYIVLAFNDSAPRIKEEDPTFSLAYKASVTPPTPTPPTPTPPDETPTPPDKTTPPDETPSKNPPSGNPPNSIKPPTSTLVRTGATVSLGAMLVLLVAGGLLLSRRREAE